MTRADTGNQAPDRYRWLALAGGLFLLERLVAWAIGISFNGEALSWYWQVIDPEILRRHLAESLFFLHAQPPLFNAVVGLAFKAGPGVGPLLLQLLFFFLGLALALVMAWSLMELRWSPPAAVAAALLLAASPGWIVYEHWLFYDFPTAVLLAAAAAGLLAAVRSPGWRGRGLFLAAITALGLTRSLFHLAWVVASVAVVALLWARPRPRRAWLVLAMPILLVGAWYGKNLAVFGFFGPSSWFGMSLAKTTVARLASDERAELVATGVLSPAAQVRPFSPIEDYERVLERHFPDRGPAVLERRLRTSGRPNFNHRAYLEIGRICGRDALRVLRLRPGVYLTSVAVAVRRFFTSGVAYPPFLDNLVVIAPLYRFGEATWSRPAVLVGAYALALIWSLIAFKRRLAIGDRGMAAFHLWVGMTLLWVLVVGSLVEIGENHRFRFVVNPLIWLALADAAQVALQRIRLLQKPGSQ